MHTFVFTQNNLKGTILLNALDAKKHFIINTHFQTLGLSANAVEKKELKTQIAALKKAKELYLNIDEFDQLAFDIIDNAGKDEKFTSFSYYFDHSDREELKTTLANIIQTINPRAIFVVITTTQGLDSFLNEDGEALRDSISLSKENSPIVLHWEEGLVNKNGIYAYIMALDHSF